MYRGSLSLGSVCCILLSLFFLFTGNILQALETNTNFKCIFKFHETIFLKVFANWWKFCRERQPIIQQSDVYIVLFVTTAQKSQNLSSCHQLSLFKQLGQMIYHRRITLQPLTVSCILRQFKGTVLYANQQINPTV